MSLSHRSTLLTSRCVASKLTAKPTGQQMSSLSVGDANNGSKPVDAICPAKTPIKTAFRKWMIEGAATKTVTGARAEATPEVLPYKAVPGPKPLPLVGNAWRFLPFIGMYSIEKLHEAMTSLHRDFGEVVRLSGLAGHPDLVFAFDPDLVEKVFRAEDAHLPRRPKMPSITLYKRQIRQEFFGDLPGVIGVHGPDWLRFRKGIQQFLLDKNTALNFLGPLDDVAVDFVNGMDDMLDANNRLPSDFLSHLHNWAFESVGTGALGTRLGCVNRLGKTDADSQRLLNAMKTFFTLITEVELRRPYARWLKTPSWRRYIAALDDFQSMCVKHVDSARKTNAPSIVCQFMERGADSRQAAILALDLLLVGVDTTAVAAASTIYELGRNPDVQEKLFAEVMSILPDPSQNVSADSVAQMRYLRACIREALRLHPVIIGNGRTLTEDLEVGGYLLPKGVHVIFPHLTLSTSEKFFSQPLCYEPERWIKGAQNDTCHPRPHAFASLPFGFGRRTCLGRRFADLELQLLIARMIRRFRIELPEVEPEYRVLPTFTPITPLNFRLSERAGSYS